MTEAAQKRRLKMLVRVAAECPCPCSADASAATGENTDDGWIRDRTTAASKATTATF